MIIFSPFRGSPLTRVFIQVWYSQQVDESNAPGYPLGYGQYRSIEPVRVVVEAGEIGDDGSSSDGGPSGTVDADGKGVPLYGRGSTVVLGNK